METQSPPDTIPFEATCKICKKELVVQIDRAFSELPNGDEEIAKLLPAATCTRCFDLMERRDKQSFRIKTQCEFMLRHADLQSEDRNKIFAALKDATEKYSAVIADYYSRPAPPHNDSWARLLMQKPDHWMASLNSMRNHVRAQLHVSEQFPPEQHEQHELPANHQGDPTVV